MTQCRKVSRSHLDSRLWFWNRGVGQVGASRAGPFMHLVPVFAATMAVAFLGEAPRLYHLGGLALMAAGLVLASTQPGPARA